MPTLNHVPPKFHGLKANQCVGCKMSGVPVNKVGFSTGGIYDTMHRTPETLTSMGVCGSCLDKGKVFYYCPQCLDWYKPNKTWMASIGSMAPRLVPCPEHSTSTEMPLVPCAVGKHQVMSPNAAMYNGRGAWFCQSHAKAIKPCGSPYCEVALHPLQTEGFGFVTGSAAPGAKLYCTDCVQFKKHPNNLPMGWNPWTWEYKQGCNCVGCTPLVVLGNARWPAAKPGTMGYYDMHCAQCDFSTWMAVASKVNGDWLCHWCASTTTVTCSKCKQPKAKSQFKYGHQPALVTPGQSVCADCLTSLGYWLCEGQCKRWFATPKYDCPCGGVNAYNYKPEIGPEQFLLTAAEKKRHVSFLARLPLMGVEIEVEAQVGKASRKTGAKLVRDIFGDVSYLVHDGSLLGTEKPNPLDPGGPPIGGQNGFEIVTYPFSYDWLNENWGRFENLFHTLTAKGFRAWEGGRCGCHIHVSRSPMTDLHQMKFIRFILGSTNMCLCVGQRDYTDKNLAKFAPFEADKRSMLIAKVRDFDNPGVQTQNGNNHYTALNSNKKATLEGRWFRGTLAPESFRKNVEFIHAVWYFTKRFGFRSANEFNFIHWLRQAPQRSDYKTLLSYLETHYITRPWDLGEARRR